jgi:hypothetical protein
MKKLSVNVRAESGFSLPTLMALAVVAGLFLLGTASLVMPACVRVATERVRDMQRSCSEAGLDWAIAQLNAPGNRADIDADHVNSSRTTSLPSSVLSNQNFTGSVTVENIPCPTYSSLYRAQLDAANPNSYITTGNGWRVVTCNITGNGFTRSVRVVLAPIYTTTTSGGAPRYYFTAAAFAGSNLAGNGNTTVNSYDSTINPNPTTFQNTGANVGTNGTASFTGNANVGGNLTVLSNGNNNAIGGPNVKVHGNIVSNGTVTGFNSSNVDGQVLQNQSNPPQTLPPAPTAPAGATDLGAVSLSGNRTMTLTAGNYVLSSLSIAGNARLNIDSSKGPVNIYVQGAGSTAGINIGGNGIVNNGQPANLRIWYNGTGNTQIAGNGNFVGVIYAPNSNISISGNGQEYGSVIGSTVQFNGNGAFHYDRSLGTNNQLTYTSTNTTRAISHWEAISWEEL